MHNKPFTVFRSKYLLIFETDPFNSKPTTPLSNFQLTTITPFTFW